MSDSSSGRLKIGDDWNAITIIALSQSNPLKAISEFVENSIDAGAKNVTITRGKEQGRNYLRIRDDGKGIPHDEEGVPNFKYVATHICDSIKKRLKTEGIKGLQGEFGIGLLSFWTVGENLVMTSAGAHGESYQMTMKKDNPGYAITKRRSMFEEHGTELFISPLLPGIKQLSGEKMQNYLASELRDRIRSSGVKIAIVDRQARAQYAVEPRKFSGRLQHHLPPIITAHGEIYFEIYLNSPDPENKVSLSRHGTRVLASLAELEEFNKEPWTSGYFQGIIDVPFLNLTPGTRTGVIQDQHFSDFCAAVQVLEAQLAGIAEAQKKAEEERASENILKSVQKALKEAFLLLPKEEYDWWDVYARKGGTGPRVKRGGLEADDAGAGPGLPPGMDGEEEEEPAQKQFFDYPGPLYRVQISPASSVVMTGAEKPLRAVARDKHRKPVEEGLEISWRIKEGGGTLSAGSGEIVQFRAPAEPGLTVVEATARQKDVVCAAESVITVTQTLLPENPRDRSSITRGLPAYSFQKAAGELWRSRYDADKNIIIINSGHVDFVFASRNASRKVRYICKLYSKELVLANFPGLQKEELLERMIELTLYSEENL